MSRDRIHYLSITDQRILNDWCCLVREMFSMDEPYGIFLVGGVITNPDYFDVDIRLMLADDVYAARYDDRKRKYLNLAVSLWGQRVTGLRIDFQIQPASVANAQYPAGPKRLPIGHPRFDPAEL